MYRQLMRKKLWIYFKFGFNHLFTKFNIHTKFNSTEYCFFPISNSTLPSVCCSATLIYSGIRVGLYRTGINTILHTDSNILLLMACQ